MSVVSVDKQPVLLNMPAVATDVKAEILRKRPRQEEVEGVAAEVFSDEEVRQPAHKMRKVEQIREEKEEKGAPLVGEKKEAVASEKAVSAAEVIEPAHKNKEIEDVSVEKPTVVAISVGEAKKLINEEIENLQKLFGHKLNFEGKACLTAFKVALWACWRKEGVAKLLQGVQSNIKAHIDCFEEKEQGDAAEILSKIEHLIKRLSKN